MGSHITTRLLTDNDIDDLARVHKKAFNNGALSYLGLGTLRRYYDWLLNGPHEPLCEAIFVDDVLAGYFFSGKFKGAMSGFLKKNRAYLVMVGLSRFYLIFNKDFRRKLKIAKRIFGRMRRDKEFSNRGLQQPYYNALVMAVDPDFQGRGFGRILMERAACNAKKLGYVHMSLTVDTDNDAAIHLYEKIGWEKQLTDGVWEGKMVWEVGKWVDCGDS